MDHVLEALKFLNSPAGQAAGTGVVEVVAGLAAKLFAHHEAAQTQQK